MAIKARKHMKLHVIRLICAIFVVAAPPGDAQARSARAAVVVDSNGNIQSFYGVPVTLTRSGLKRLPFRVKEGHYYAEGDRYTNYTITALAGVKVDVTFEEDGKLYKAETVSPTAVGLKGTGVGSTLADVRREWPGGTLIFGFADGEYVTYITGTNVLLRFNPDDMPKGAFDHQRPYDFPVPDTIKVEKISIYPKPNPVPKGLELPDPNKNLVTAQTTDGQIISKLDVSKTPGSSLVRLAWTHQGKIAADQSVDVSGYPDFDIWTRWVVHEPDPVVVSFRYGNFKNCGVREDDRDQVYITLSGTGATISPSPPQDKAIMEDPSMPKYVGNSMKSAAHGCRRTYAPSTGAFGLEKAQ